MKILAGKWSAQVILWICILHTGLHPLWGQTADILIDKQYQGQPLKALLQTVENDLNIQFFYKSAWIDTLTVVQSAVPSSLNNILSNSLKVAGLTWYQDIHGRIFLTPRSVASSWETRESSLVPLERPQSAIEKQAVLSLRPESESPFEEKIVEIEIGAANPSEGETATLVGYVRDETSGEPIIGAAVFVAALQLGVTTDQYGYYSLSLPKGAHTIGFRSYGKEERQQPVTLMGDGKLDMEMTNVIRQLDEVVIEAERDANVASTQMGVSQLSIQTLKQMPSFMGEIDVIKSTLLLPGVQSVGEGASGFNVRGGSVDQNLILINQAPIFNPSHLFGFFSVFNPDVIKSFDLYKSGIPARYGGRISSVLDIAMKDGNQKEVVGTGGVSPVTARFTLEGPLKYNNSSFIIGARSSYSNWLLNRLPIAELRNSRVAFSDLNGKIKLDISDKDRVDISSYGSRDRFVLNGDTSFTYYNFNAALNWKHLFNNKLYAVSSAIFSHYNYQVARDSSSAAFKLNYRIRYQELKTDFTYIPEPKHQIRFGANAILYQLDPGNMQPGNSESLVLPKQLPHEQAIESGFYISDEWDISPRFKLYGGLRYSMFFFLGPYTAATYAANSPRLPENIIDSTRYRGGSVAKFYAGPEVRLSARFGLDDKTSLKLSYNRLRQYLHMLTNTTAISPTDTWKLSDPYIRPQTGDQFSLGIYRNLRQNSIETSVEFYVKRIGNMLEFKNGAQLLLNDNVETEVINGLGRAYGVELLIRKDRGKLNGWISYTYARIFAQVDGDFPDEKINRGEPYPANVDKPHDFSLVSNYKFSRRLSISSNIAYSTGRPITYPVAQFQFGNNSRLNYSLRNQFRVPDYLRWDFSINVEGNHRIKKFAHTSWSLSFFNVLGRKNVYSIYFVSGANGIEGYKLSIFGKPFTTLTFNFKL